MPSLNNNFAGSTVRGTKHPSTPRRCLRKWCGGPGFWCQHPKLLHTWALARRGRLDEAHLYTSATLVAAGHYIATVRAELPIHTLNRACW